MALPTTTNLLNLKDDTLEGREDILYSAGLTRFDDTVLNCRSSGRRGSGWLSADRKLARVETAPLHPPKEDSLLV